MNNSDMPERIWAKQDERIEDGLTRMHHYWSPTKNGGVIIDGVQYIRADLYDQLRKEVTSLAQESVEREKTLARLEAEVLALRELVTPRPIETVPDEYKRYGTWILIYLYSDGDERHSGSYFAIPAYYQQAGQQWMTIGGNPVFIDSTVWITHWLPMPPTPEVNQ